MTMNLRPSFPILAALLTLSLTSPTHAQAPATGTPHASSEILTVGNGDASLSPDRAIVRIGMETHASTAAQASSRNAEKVKSVIEALRKLGYNVDSLRTVGFGVSPNYSYEEGRRLIDYQAVATLRLVVSRLDRLGETLDAVLTAGATDVSNIQFESDREAAGRGEALAKALAMARADAAALAAAAGGSLGRLLEATTQAGFPVPMMRESFDMRASNQVLPPQDVVVMVTVQARWEMVGGDNR